MNDQEADEFNEQGLELILRFDGWNQNRCYDVYDSLGIFVGRAMQKSRGGWIFVTERAILNNEELHVLSDFLTKKEQEDAGNPN